MKLLALMLASLALSACGGVEEEPAPAPTKCYECVQWPEVAGTFTCRMELNVAWECQRGPCVVGLKSEGCAR